MNSRSLLIFCVVVSVASIAEAQLMSFTESFTGGTPQILLNPTVSVSSGAANTTSPVIITGGTDFFLDPNLVNPSDDMNLDADLLGDGIGDGHLILDTAGGNTGNSIPGINFVIGTITADDVGSIIFLDVAVFQASDIGHVTEVGFLLDSDGNDGNNSVLGVEFSADTSTDPTDEDFFGPAPNLEDYSVLPVRITDAHVGSELSVRFELFSNAFGDRDLGIDTIVFSVVPVPEPNSFVLFGLAGSLVAFRRRRR